MPTSSDDQSSGFKKLLTKLTPKWKKEDSNVNLPRGFKYRTNARNITPEERATAPNLGERGWGRDSWSNVQRRQQQPDLTPTTSPDDKIFKRPTLGLDSSTKTQTSHLSMMTGPPTPSARLTMAEQERRDGQREGARNWGDHRRRAEVLLGQAAHQTPAMGRRRGGTVSTGSKVEQRKEGIIRGRDCDEQAPHDRA